MPHLLIIEGLEDGRAGVAFQREGQDFAEPSEPVEFEVPLNIGK